MDRKLRTSIIKELESLVHCRFTGDKLADKLSEILKRDIDELQDTTAEDCDEDLEYDYCITTGNDFVIVDIYYLPMRNGNYYITEVGYDFDGII